MAAPTDAAHAATFFAHARVANSRVDQLPACLSADDEAFGYAVQAAQLSPDCTAAAPLGAHVGWKIGATNAGAQASMGFGPFYGPLFASSVHDSGATLSLTSLGNFKAAEAEFAFVMGTDLLPADGKDVTEDQCWAAVSHVAPAIELAASRLAAEVKPAPAAVLSDCSFNGAVILAPPDQRVASSDTRPDALPSAGAALVVDGATVASHTGANVLGNPLTALCWLANALRHAAPGGQHLRKGDVIMTGAAVVHKPLPPGQTLEAHFTGLTPGGGDAKPLVVRVHIA